MTLIPASQIQERLRARILELRYLAELTGSKTGRQKEYRARAGELSDLLGWISKLC